MPDATLAGPMPTTAPTMNVGWDRLLDRLAEVPRENGTPEIHEAATFLADALSAAGAAVEKVAFTAQPYGLRLTGVLVLAAGLLYFRLMLARRFGAALLVAVGAPALAFLQLDLVAPVVGWIGEETQHHIVGRLAAEAPEHTLIFTAHYDTKTDLLDHVERAPVDFLAMAVVPFMLLGAAGGIAASRRAARSLSLERLVRLAAAAGAAYGVAAFAALSAGALVPWRSPGALDDGASCAVLVRLAEALAAGPPLARTDVEVVLLSAEEVGVQGSWVYARERFPTPPERPTLVVNLEGIGASQHLAVLGGERFMLRSFDPGEEVVSLLDEVHRARRGRPLPITPYGGATDARSFLARGVPAATLVSREPGTLFTRDLHSAGDDRERIDLPALDASLSYLLELVRAADRAP